MIVFGWWGRLHENVSPPISSELAFKKLAAQTIRISWACARRDRSDPGSNRTGFRPFLMEARGLGREARGREI